ncbi:MAG: hypothetical protein LBH86_08840 [Oscillospiraceae bacterium]|jgi:hypothetical protein|nr:hypothetical protein [Oscillospiraceae bacterium]
MNGKDLYRAVGGIEEKYIEAADAARGKKAARAVKFAPWLRWAMPAAACLVIAAAMGIPAFLRGQPDNGGADPNKSAVFAGGDVESGAVAESAPDGAVSEGAAIGETVPKPDLRLESGRESAASYAAPDYWRGLPTENFVLEEQNESGIAVDRMVFTTLQELADRADAWVVVLNVHDAVQDGGDKQTSVAEYTETIGGALTTRQWDDYTVSNGNRILIRQRLIGGCTMDEPNNLLRVGGVYLLPVRFNEGWGAYEVTGDLDVLFELDNNGKIMSHTRYPDLNRYDGMNFQALIDDVRALYPAPTVVFTEQPIHSAEEAQTQVETAYALWGFRKFSAAFERETTIKGAPVYLFEIALGENGSSGSEYAWIAKRNGAFQRGHREADGSFIVAGGLGSFPKDSHRENEGGS